MATELEPVSAVEVERASSRVDELKDELRAAEDERHDVWWRAYHYGMDAGEIARLSGRSARTVWRELHRRMLDEDEEAAG